MTDISTMTKAQLREYARANQLTDDPRIDLRKGAEELRESILAVALEREVANRDPHAPAPPDEGVQEPAQEPEPEETKPPEPEPEPEPETEPEPEETQPPEPEPPGPEPETEPEPEETQPPEPEPPGPEPETEPEETQPPEPEPYYRVLRRSSVLLDGMSCVVAEGTIVSARTHDMGAMVNAGVPMVECSAPEPKASYW